MDKCVSVVIPSFNRAHILGLTIPSYVQDNVGEIIIVDDCSLDNTEATVNELILQYPIIKYFKNEINSGTCFSKNIGIKNAIYDYIYFGDDDSFILKSTISVLLTTAISYKVNLVGGLQIAMKDKNDFINRDLFIDNIISNKILNIKEYIDFSKMKLSFSFYVDEPIEVPVCHASMLIKSEIAKSLLFDEFYIKTAYREETDFIIRANLMGNKIMYQPKAMQINLPRDMVKGGGAHNGSKIWRYKSIIECNNYFLDKNYNAIRLKYPDMESKLSLKYSFIYGIVKQMAKDPIIDLFKKIGVLHLFIKPNKYD